MSEKIKLSGRELDVMNVFWESNNPITAKEITELNSSLSINTVQAVLKGLLKKEYIKVADIVYSGTVLTRSYTPVLNADEYMANQITNEFHNKRVSAEGIVAALLKNEESEETLYKLEEMLKQYRANRNKGE